MELWQDLAEHRVQGRRNELDVPGKYEVLQARTTRGVMADEWVDGEWMDMYEMHDAMQAAGIKKFNTLMLTHPFFLLETSYRIGSTE